MSESKLLPCPFCGSEPYYDFFCDPIIGKQKYFISCDCELSPRTRSYLAKEKAEDAWNQRADKEDYIMNRRDFLKAMSTLIATPAIVKADNIMRINPQILLPKKDIAIAESNKVDLTLFGLNENTEIMLLDGFNNVIHKEVISCNNFKLNIKLDEKYIGEDIEIRSINYGHKYSSSVINYQEDTKVHIYNPLDSEYN